MTLSLYLGQLLSIVLVVIGLALILNTNHYITTYKAWMKNEALMLFTAMVILVTGVALALAHNIWVLSWEVLITIIGYGAIVKGAFILFLPKAFEKLVDELMKTNWLLKLGGAIWVIGGLYLGYYAWLV